MTPTTETVPAATQTIQPSAHTPSRPGRRVVHRASILVGCSIAAVLAALTLDPANVNKPVGHPVMAEHGSIRSIEGSVEDATPGAHLEPRR